MDKTSFIIVLQSALFSFDGLSFEEIKKIYYDYPDSLIRTGIKISNHLKQTQLNKKEEEIKA